MIGVIFKVAQEKVVEWASKEEAERCCMDNMSMNGE
jgi:hypothetical protein